MNIKLDDRIFTIIEKHTEIKGIIYCLNTISKDFKGSTLNCARDTVSSCLYHINESKSLITQLQEEPKQIPLSIFIQGYKKVLTAFTLIENCTDGIRNIESESDELKSHYTMALFAVFTLLHDLVAIYESILETQPAKQAA